MRTRASILLLAFGWLCCAAAPAGAQQLAFPTAEGFGRFAQGGRGGEVYHVTTLKDSGPGSLREAVRKGPRVVVFDVAGYIDLKSPLHVASNITIAGQTAPGQGVSTRYQQVSFDGSKDVIVRFIRFRQGVSEDEDKKTTVTIAKAHDLILDHVSIAWGRQGSVDLSDSSNVTFQNCLIGPGIAPDKLGASLRGDNLTFSHCLFIHNQGGSPRAQGKVQFVNNVVYNWLDSAFVEGGAGEKTWDDLVGNYFIAGPATSDRPPFSSQNDNAQVYASDNYLDTNRNGKLDGEKLFESVFSSVKRKKKPFATATVTIDPAKDAYQKIVDGVGCSLQRDSVDERLIADLKSLGKKGQLVKEPADMGGWGSLVKERATAKSPADGIPDSWKKAHNLDLKDPNVFKGDYSNDSFTNVEKYLNELAGDGKAADGPGLFALRVQSGSFRLKKSGRTNVMVVADRKGYKGPIRVELQNLPGHVGAVKGLIDRGQSQVTIQVSADAQAAGSSRADVKALGTATEADNKQIASASFTVSVDQPAKAKPTAKKKPAPKKKPKGQ